MKIKKTKTLLYILLLFCFLTQGVIVVNAKMPFYNLNPKEIVLRSQFYTTYSSSNEERKNNIYLASKSLNNTFVDVGGEFSFNKTVGERTIKRGYKVAKIIFNGSFIEGVGGGVCQVSTTLYNAVLLAGLTITEYHPHSLAVSYVAPSFDAMVNSGSADLRFVNNTENPIIIKTIANGERLTVQIYGEESQYKYERVSVTTEEIPAPKERVIIDEKGEYPDLLDGEQKTITYSKKGLKSTAYIVKKKNGKMVEVIKLRKDKYNPITGLIVVGKEKDGVVTE